MSFGGKLIHELTIQRFSNGTADDYNQPAQIWATHATVRGLPQPKSIREMALVSQAGAVVGDWTVFLLPSDLRESDRILHDQATCPVPSVNDLPSGTFEPTGIRNAAGVGHHLEVDARLIAPAVLVGS